MTEKRTHCVSSRFSPSELAQLDEWRGGVRRGEYVRQATLGNPPVVPPTPNAEAYKETARWASNLNQIAKHLNGDDLVEIEEIRYILKGFRLALLGVVMPDEGKDK